MRGAASQPGEPPPGLAADDFSALTTFFGFEALRAGWEEAVGADVAG